MSKKKRHFRGSGVKHTIRFMGRYSGLWLLASIGSVIVASWSSYLVFAERFDGDSSQFFGELVFQTLFIVVALLCLAIFTTHRIAGPWIAVRRALDDVANGDFDRQLTIRSTDRYLREVESSFEQMMVTIREQAEPSDESAGTPPAAD